MKIVHICLSGAVTDGFSYQDNLLSKYHKLLGFDVSFVTSKWIYDENGKITRTNKTHYFNDDGVYMVRLDNKDNETYNQKFKHFYGLRKTLEEEKPDILFIHGVQFLDMPDVVSYVKKNNTRVYVDNHADFSNSGRNFASKFILQGIIWKHMAQIVAPYTTKFYGVLPARVDWLINMYKLPSDKCELLVMGADDDEARRASDPIVGEKIRSKYGIGKNDFLIITGGKIDAAKTQTLLLIQAVQRIEDPKVKLLVFGSVADEIKKDFASLVDGKKVQYMGWVKGNYSYDVFSTADLVVFPGRHSVFWEQVCGQGKPMIVKYWEGTTHIDLGGNVEFLYKDSVDEIYEKITEIVGDPQKYEKMRAVAESKGMETFSYKKIAERAIAFDSEEC